MSLKTRCPLVRKEAVIKKIHQNVKSLQLQRKSLGAAKSATRNNRLSLDQPAIKRKSTLQERRRTKTDEPPESNFKRENPYHSGSALKKFERGSAPDEFK